RRHRRTAQRRGPRSDRTGREREDRGAPPRPDGAEQMNRYHTSIATLALAAGVTIAAVSLTAQQQQKKTLSDGVFSAEQAQSGKAGYDGVCKRCHGDALQGSQGNGPTLKGSPFLAHWDKDTLG